ncbi:MAG: flagellar basal-body MS-ring/collar protein FliF [Pseudomonadota bacterium]
MTALLENWNNLNPSRKIVAGLGVVAMVIVIVSLVRMVTQPSMTLLYSGLEARQAGDVVRVLEQRGEVYDVKGGAIFVPSGRRDELRLTLASEGLPANSSQGYELLDSLSGFGTTSQMFEAAYLRAKEGELARTIVSSSQISMARVHIAHSASGAFTRNRIGSASIFVTPTSGTLDTAQARALRFLVASAVAGLAPENVSIIDDSGNLLGSDPSNTAETAGADLPSEMKDKVERMLAARVGAGNAIVEVSVETVTQSESITERIFDPESRVVISTDNEERTDSAEDSGSSGVTVASNLPEGDGASDENSKSQTSETRERVNYEVSETKREIVKAPGSIKRLSVAVLVNGVEDPAAPGAVQPRSAEELEQLGELVRSAVGYDEARGDMVTVQSMVFTPAAPLGSGPAERPFIDMTLDAMSLIQMAILGIVGIVIAMFVVRPILSAKTSGEVPALAPPDRLAPEPTDILDGEIDFVLPENGLVPAERAANSAETGTSDSPIQRLREMIETRQEETVDILRQWLEQKERQGSS